MPACVPEFDGNLWLDVDFLEFFMNYVTNTNLVFEDDLMMALEGSMQGNLCKEVVLHPSTKRNKVLPLIGKDISKGLDNMVMRR
jgi:hypothetical protein